MGSSISVVALTEGRTTIVSVSGDVDVRSRGRLSVEALPHAAVAERFVLDLSRVGFVDSTGVSEVVRIRQALAARRLSLHVVPSRRALAALTLSAVVQTVVVHDSVAAALAHQI